MASAKFEHDIFIAAAPETVRGLLSEMNNRTEMHPLVVSIRHVSTTTAGDGARVDTYLIRDRMKMGPFTIHFTYRTDFSVNAAGDFVSDAYQSPGIHLHNVISCNAEGSGTRVTEHVKITAPSLLMKTTYDAAVSSHRKMFATLKTMVEAVQ